MPNAAAPFRNRPAEDLTRFAAARFENIGRYRAAFGRCRPSFWKELGLRRLREADQLRVSNPEEAAARFAEVPHLLASAMAASQRR